MSARIEPERQRVLAAIKPTQGGSPLPAIRAGDSTSAWVVGLKQRSTWNKRYAQADWRVRSHSVRGPNIT